MGTAWYDRSKSTWTSLTEYANVITK